MTTWWCSSPQNLAQLLMQARLKFRREGGLAVWAAHLLEQLPLQSQDLCNDLIIWCCHQQLGVVLEDLPLLLRGARVLDACRGAFGWCPAMPPAHVSWRSSHARQLHSAPKPGL